MSPVRFFWQTAILSIGVALGIYFLNQIPRLAEFRSFTWSCFAFFILLSIVMFFFARKASKSKTKNLFTSVALGFTGSKMFFSVILIVAYDQIWHPSSRLFVLPFLGIYLIYTIFETYFMMKLGKVEPD